MSSQWHHGDRMLARGASHLDATVFVGEHVDDRSGIASGSSARRASPLRRRDGRVAGNVRRDGRRRAHGTPRSTSPKLSPASAGVTDASRASGRACAPRRSRCRARRCQPRRNAASRRNRRYCSGSMVPISRSRAPVASGPLTMHGARRGGLYVDRDAR